MKHKLVMTAVYIFTNNAEKIKLMLPDDESKTEFSAIRITLIERCKDPSSTLDSLWYNLVVWRQSPKHAEEKLHSPFKYGIIIYTNESGAAALHVKFQEHKDVIMFMYSPSPTEEGAEDGYTIYNDYYAFMQKGDKTILLTPTSALSNTIYVDYFPIVQQNDVVAARVTREVHYAHIIRHHSGLDEKYIRRLDSTGEYKFHYEHISVLETHTEEGPPTEAGQYDPQAINDEIIVALSWTKRMQRGMQLKIPGQLTLGFLFPE